MRSREKSKEVEPLDPIAVTLAIWLGLVVGVTGLVRMSEDAANQAAIAQAFASPAAGSPANDVQPFNPRLMAFGN